jgi:two-component system, OmpR family, sensor histidine kinase KdpD
VNGFGSIWAGGRHGWGRTVLTAAAGPGLVTLLTVLDRPIETTTASMLYVLVVVLASALEGPVSGVTASLLSFLALNFFFTPPVHTFAVGKSADLIALCVFLVVSVVTGILLATVLEQKSRAERRETQTRLLNRFTSQLLTGQRLDEVLHDLARRLVDLFGLTTVEIETVMTTTSVTAAATGGVGGEQLEFELTSKIGTIGTMRVTLPGARASLDNDEYAVLQGFASQLALALESVRLSDEMKRISLDAETSQLRAALFSSVTHDLKTPLSAITASVTSLLDGGGFSQAERFEHLETIKQEADHLNRVVSNLLDLSRLRAGALTPAKAPAGIDEVIEAVVSRLQPLLIGREVIIDIDEDLPEVPMDLVQVDQVLTNLIENAVKFSPPATPVRIAAVGNEKGVRVTVADKGPGIPEGERDRVFLPFERGTTQGAGTGLGLAIATAVVAAHGGRLWARDEPGGGAALTFELPIDREEVKR